MMRTPGMRQFSFLMLLPIAGSMKLAAADEPQAKTRPAGGPQPTVKFLDAEAARTAIVDDTVDPYFKNLQPLEIAALTGELLTATTLEEQREECRRRFQDGMLDFTDRERGALRRLIEDLYPVMLRRYPLFAAQPWSFIKSSGNLCGSMAYTRGPHIIWPEPMCRFAVGAASRRTAPARPLAIEILVREQMHVFQRAHPHFFDSLYKDVFGFRFAEKLELHPRVVQYQLSNPDGTDCRWIYPLRDGQPGEFILPLLMLDNRQKEPPLASMQKTAVFIQKTDDGYKTKTSDDDKPVLRRLDGVREFGQRFAGVSSNYHPNEAAADLFAEAFVAYYRQAATARAGEPPEDAAEEDDSTEEQSPSERMRAQTRQWYAKHLAAVGRARAQPQAAPAK